MQIKKTFKKVSHRLLKPVMDRYLASERDYQVDDIRITVRPGVFHP